MRERGREGEGERERDVLFSSWHLYFVLYLFGIVSFSNCFGRVNVYVLCFHANETQLNGTSLRENTRERERARDSAGEINYCHKQF